MSDRFSIVPKEARKRRQEVKPNAYALYIELCSYRNRETAQCTPTKAEQMEEVGLSQSRWYEARACLVEHGWARFPVTDGGQIDLLIGFEIPDSRKTGNQQVTAFPENGKPTSYSESIPDSRKTGNQQVTAFPIPGNREIPDSRKPGMLIGRTENSLVNRETAAAATRAHEGEPAEQGQSAVNEQREYQRRSQTKPEPAKTNQGKFQYGDYLAYLQAKNPEKQLAQAAGLARILQLDGRDDEAVAAWLKGESARISLVDDITDNDTNKLHWLGEIRKRCKPDNPKAPLFDAAINALKGRDRPAYEQAKQQLATLGVNL